MTVTPVAKTGSLSGNKSGAKSAALAIALMGWTAVVGCSPTIHSHGYTPRANELDEISVGTDTRQSIQQKLGRPSTISAFTDAEWYYISVKTETMAFYSPEVIEQRVVTVTFDDTGTVTDIGRYGLEDGQVIDLVTRTTPTSGRQLTIVQQIFGNIGRFNAESVGASTPGGLPGR